MTKEEAQRILVFVGGPDVAEHLVMAPDEMLRCNWYRLGGKVRAGFAILAHMAGERLSDRWTDIEEETRKRLAYGVSWTVSKALESAN